MRFVVTLERRDVLFAVLRLLRLGRVFLQECLEFLQLVDEGLLKRGRIDRAGGRADDTFRNQRDHQQRAQVGGHDLRRQVLGLGDVEQFRSTFLRIVQHGNAETIAVALRSNQVVFEAAGVVLSSRLIDGQFPNVRQLLPEAYEHELQLKGAEITEVSMPHFEHAMAAYYLILPAECSSNLAKFDAMRYGLRVTPEGSPSAEDVMKASRDAGFGDEVKRRIMIGTYALSSGYYDAYYGQAQKIRTLIIEDFKRAFAQVDVLVSPTAPSTAFPIGEKVDDPLSMYLQDLATIPANLAGVPGISIPSGTAPEDGLPTGVQFLAPELTDERLYLVGAALEAALVELWGGPIAPAAYKEVK